MINANFVGHCKVVMGFHWNDVEVVYLELPAAMDSVQTKKMVGLRFRNTINQSTKKN